MRIMDFIKTDFGNDKLIIENNIYSLSKISSKFKYLPTYDMLLDTIRKDNPDKLRNYGLSHFDFAANNSIISKAWNKIKDKFDFALISNN